MIRVKIRLLQRGSTGGDESYGAMIAKGSLKYKELLDDRMSSSTSKRDDKILIPILESSQATLSNLYRPTSDAPDQREHLRQPFMLHQLRWKADNVV